MPVGHPDLASEQQYIEQAHEVQQRERQRLADAPDAGGDKVAMREIRAQVLKRIAQDIDPESLCFGRIDQSDARTLYIGRDGIRGVDNSLLVINWRVPAAAPFYEASRAEPGAVIRRRRFQLERIRLRGIVDEVLNGDGATHTQDADSSEVEPPVQRELVDAILADMERARSAEMRDIVSTIEAEQYRLISDEIDGLLVVQGGPGTGKTAIALHRAAWLIFNHREELERSRVLVVGPNRAFMEYVAKVLPSLGETAVDQFAVDRLGGAADLRARNRDADDVSRLKGDPRMARVIRNAVWDRVRPVEAPVTVRVQGTDHQVPAAVVNEILEGLQSEEREYLAARETFRKQFVDAAAARIAERGPRLRRGPSRSDLVAELSSAQPGIERIWPALSATEAVRELFSNREQMRRASADVLDDDERALLYRPRARQLRDEPWTAPDIALLDEAQSVLSSEQVRYGYVIVDEAQDLSPMQVRVVARRSTAGRMTLVGDLAQATGAWRYRSWDELIAHFPGDTPSRIAELALGYRVPAQVMELAGALVPRIADGLLVPQAVRRGPEDPRTTRAEEPELLEAIEAEVWRRLDGERSVAVIAPTEMLAALQATLSNAGLPVGDVSSDGLSEKVTLLAADEAKGLEFDHVIVAEPAGIVTETQDWAKLYVALTRATRTLSIVHTTEEPIPDEVRGAPVIDLEPISTPREPQPVLDRLGPRYTEALMRAKFLHVNQQRRGTGVPYFAHLMAVSALVLEDGGSEDEAIAALLHDAVEDHGIQFFEGIADQFGLPVAEMVAGCTDPDVGEATWREMKTQHLATLELAGPRVRRVALAEKLDNARALLRDYRTLGPLLWERMDVNHEDLLWYLLALADLFEVERPGDMASELRDTVDRLLEAVTES